VYPSQRSLKYVSADSEAPRRSAEHMPRDIRASPNEDKMPEHPGISLEDIIRDILSYMLYLLGMIIIEMYLKPMFGANGIPIICNLILIGGELCLLIKLLWRLLDLIDAFVRDFSKSYLCKIARNIISKWLPILKLGSFFSHQILPRLLLVGKNSTVCRVARRNKDRTCSLRPKKP
jgi:hypothetical protein